MPDASIIVKPLAALLSQPASVHHLPQHDRRPILAIARLLMQHLHDRQAGVQADEIRQLQRTHGHVGPVPHDVVDVLFGADAGLKAYDRFVDVRH